MGSPEPLVRLIGGAGPTYFLSPEATPGGAAIVEALRAELLASGQPDEIVALVHRDGPITMDLDQATGTQATGLGWEYLMLPGASGGRRVPRLAAGLDVTFGLADIADDTLLELDPRSADYLADPSLMPHDCGVVRQHGTLVAWMPVLRLSASTCRLRAVVGARDLYPDSPTRLSVLRLGLASRTFDHLLAQGMAVVSWIPATDDPVNDYKAQVGGAARITYWVAREVRRDLQPVAASEPTAGGQSYP